jgi:hypothetical protein
VSLAELAAQVGRRDANDVVDDIVDVITYIEAPWGLDLRLYPVQRVILKCTYGLALDENAENFPLDVPVPTTHPAYDPELVDEDGYYKNRIEVTDWRKENVRYMTEAQYLEFLYNEGRCNIKKVVPGEQRRDMVLSVGRRSGKTLLTSCVVAYETYKLLLKANPQRYYGFSQSNVIQLISVATDKDQAALLYQEAAGHFQKCDYFKPYAANSTQSFATFQTPYDIDKYGSYHDNPKARYSVKVTFRSCVAKGLRGGNNILVALDEAAHFGEKGQGGADEVHQAVSPSAKTFLPKDPNNKARPIGENEGRVIMISSPLGKQGLFYKQFRMGFEKRAGKNILSFQAPTWEVNPTIDGPTFEAEYLKDPTAFFTEFGAEFTDRTRGWIEDKKDLLACIVPDLRPKLRSPPRAPHFLGLDVALVGDYSALAVGHNEPDGTVVCDFYERIRAGEGDFADLERLEFDDVADWVYDVSRRFYIHEGIFDQWAGIPMEQALVKRGLSQMKSIHHTRQLSSQMFQNFKNMMMDRKIALYDFPIPDGEEHSDLIREILELQAEVVSKYIVKVEAPNMDGKHDDLSDALVRMVWTATQNSGRVHAVRSVRSQRGYGLSTASVTRFAHKTQRVRSGSHPSRQTKVGGGRRR